MPSQITRVLKCFAAVGALPGATCFVGADVFNMALQVTLVRKDLSALVTSVALVILKK